MKRKRRTTSLIVFIVFLQSCARVIYPYSEVDGGLLGGCFRAESNFQLYGNKSETPFMGRYIIFPEGGELSYAMLDAKKYKQTEFVGQLRKGDRMQVERVLLYKSAWAPSYLRIIARIVDGEHKGKSVDWSAYVKYHPWPPVIASSTLDPEKVEFRSEYLVFCNNDSGL